MLFGVPQFIDMEDKIVGPLTAKQLGWLAIAGVIALVLYATLDMTAFIIACIPDFLFAAALAFYKPFGQSLPDLISNMFSFILKPKVYIWNKVVESSTYKPDIAKRSSRVENKLLSKNNVSRKNISEISDLLDITKK